jgi:hypothetical protein
MPLNVKKENQIMEPNFFKKVVGYLLRMGIAPKKFEKNALVRRLITGSARLLISLRLGTFVQVCVGQDVGFSTLKMSQSKLLLIGYFQTHHYMNLPQVSKVMKNLELTQKSTLLVEHENLARTENPLVVHVRLGDYRFEENFGTLTENYYKNIEALWGSNRYNKIWLFSDEPNAAIEIIPEALRKHTRIINDQGETPATTLELMRLGTGYLIANSSLSWWGAMLSRSEEPVVIAPQPWFKSMPEPNQLIPRHWLRRDGFISDAVNLPRH